MTLTPAMSQVNDCQFLLFLFGAPRVCLWMKIKCYKNTITIKHDWVFIKDCLVPDLDHKHRIFYDFSAPPVGDSLYILSHYFFLKKLVVYRMALIFYSNNSLLYTPEIFCSKKC